MAADKQVRTYDPAKVIVSFGVAYLTGFADGTFISIERSGPAFEKKRGADGTVDRVNKNAFDFKVVVTLKQTSPNNGVLSGLMQLDQITNGGMLPLTVKDLSGNTLFFAPQAWISEDPKSDYSDALSNRAWTFETGLAEKFDGGN